MFANHDVERCFSTFQHSSIPLFQSISTSAFAQVHGRREERL
jgi:hypothetical protein